MMASMNINAGQLMSSVTLTFTLTRTYRFRMWLGARVIGLAGLILGTSMIVVEVNGDDAASTVGHSKR